MLIDRLNTIIAPKRGHDDPGSWGETIKGRGEKIPPTSYEGGFVSLPLDPQTGVRQMAKRRKSLRSLSKAQLERYATKLLAKKGFYKKPEVSDEEHLCQMLERKQGSNTAYPEMISAHGHLKAMWTGRP